ncbi:hypothetical protein OG548_20000 [Streptomyces sp. NBC_01356]|uniref:hypothetical protein n=1 Tax=Streptomyces sp. NBC_01356 TaxID=2903836 RepID=UPI002E36B7A2|nr:hypothetical protein [Streptomyces sp. NBC_01356]
MFGCYSFPNHVLADRDDLGNGIEAVSLRTALTEELPSVRSGTPRSYGITRWL